MTDTIDRAVEIYRSLLLIRRFEERVVDLVNSNEIPGVTHEYVGQEAVAVGVCQVLRPDDVITSTHRGHGHLIAKGGDVRRMMAELLAKETGLNRARGGSMHIADLSLGIYGANGIVGGGVPFAAGAAWAAKRDGADRVAVAFFGDGGINQGVVHETMNLAAIWGLPVVFVCENNRYAVTFPAEQASALPLDERASSYGFESRQVDGMDVQSVFDAASAAIDKARRGGGPTFLDCQTYRFFGHHTAERVMKLGYRTDDEIARWQARDPLIAWPKQNGLTDDQLEQVSLEVDALLDDAVAFARESPEPKPEDALSYVYATGSGPEFPMKGWWDGASALPASTE